MTALAPIVLGYLDSAETVCKHKHICLGSHPRRLRFGLITNDNPIVADPVPTEPPPKGTVAKKYARLKGSEPPRIHLLFAAGRDTHPGKLGNCIVFSGMRPAPRCHEAISSGAHVPDALVSAK